MPTSETRDGPTPSGGVRSEIIYLDAAGNAAEKDAATACEIVEYDAAGNQVFRSYGTIGGK